MNTSANTSRLSTQAWGALALIVVAQFMVLLDLSIVNVALPSIESDLSFSQSSLQWVISAYAIPFGGFLLLGGRLADIVGRRRVFSLGVAIFTVASILSGFAWSASALIAFRALQGFGGALFVPAALSLLMTTFAEGPERNLALGIWGSASASGAAAGVLLGGILTSALSWPWIFFLNVPVGALLLVLTPRLLRESKGAFDTRHFDLAGASSVTAAIMLFVYGLTHGAEQGWSDPLTVGLLVGSALLLVAFVAIERRAAAPLLPLRIFRVRTLAAANVVVVVVASIAFSEFFLLTLYMQHVLGYSPLQTGAGFLAFALTVATVSQVAPRLTTRFGARRVLVAGMLLAAAPLASFVRLPVTGHYGTDLGPEFVLNAIGMGLCFVPMTIAGLAGVERADAGIASGLINTSRQLGGAVGLAVVSTIAAGSQTTGLAAKAAATDSFRTAFLVLTGLALAGAAISAIFLVPHEARQHVVEDFELAEAA
jgi:EmrB/QacA subfamily drug resistance transporter